MTGDGMQKGKVYALEGFAVPGELNAVHDLLGQAVDENPGLDSTDVMLFEMAILEIASNVVEHGRPPGQVRWKLSIQVRADAIEAELNDTGQAFTPVRGKTMPGEDAESGRGLPIVEALLDQIEFERMDDTNHWHMLRRLGRTSQG